MRLPAAIPFAPYCQFRGTTSIMLTRLARKPLPLACALCLLAAIAAYSADRFASASQLPSDDTRAPVAQAGDVIPGRYVVVLEDGIDAGRRAQLYRDAFPGADIDHVYDEALNGFAGELPKSAVAALVRDPSVASVEPDRLLTIVDEMVPTGIDRIDAEPIDPPNTIGVDTDIDVAVIDTGVGPSADLRVEGGFASFAQGFWYAMDCGRSGPWDDGHGHGTAVAGVIGARDNAEGVVGVAPGARIWSVRVIGSAGFACSSDVIAGVDWVTQHAGVIDVVNMSLSGGNNIGLCEAIANSVAAGVTYAVAAGNTNFDAVYLSPANCPDVITVSALADFDGRPGGLASRSVAFSACTETRDDSRACFSSFGSVVDLTAPGVEIVSTALNGLSAPMSGTSLAAPHVAGAAALYLTQHPATSPANVRAALIASGECPGGEPVGSDEYCNSPWPDDADGFNEPLVRVRGSSWDAPGIPEPPLAATTTPTVSPTPTVTLTPTVTRTPTVTLTPGPDRDHDQLSDLLEVTYYGTDPDNPDTDGDSCSDGAEVGPDPMHGGLRDPLNPFDFFDVDGDGAVTIDDISAVPGGFLLVAGQPGYERRYDRGDILGPHSWNVLAPDGAITIDDVVAVAAQFNHACGRPR